jgi:Ca-activated chloride channel family protein
MMGDFHFLRPWWLVALAPAALLLWLLWRRQDDRRAWRGIIADHLLPHLLVGAEQRPRFRPVHALAAGWLIGIVALAGPTWRREPAPFADESTVLAIVVKVSPSMNDSDVQPTRQARAAQKVHDLLAQRQGGKTALIAYAGTSHLVMPLTSDGAVIDTFARDLSADVMPVPGDDAAAAIAKARDLVTRSSQAGWVLWVADGVTPAQIEKLKAEGVPVRVLAVGGEGGERESLERAASALGTSVDVLTADDADVRRLSRNSRFSTVAGEGEGGQRWRDAGWWLVPIAALLALLWFRPGWMVRGGT